MKKIITKVLMVVAAIFMLSSCGLADHLTTNANLQQTNVVLSQKNFHVVKTVESTVSGKYWFGIGNFSKKALQQNAVAELNKKAELTGSQAMINVAVQESVKVCFIFAQYTYYAQGTVIEFDE
jgi:uncharacterized protein YbjQ (UPF0145 family)